MPSDRPGLLLSGSIARWLVASIAHEVNQPIAATVTNAEAACFGFVRNMPVI
jgi:hypothetical protein